jgi:hypothetical protein
MENVNGSNQYGHQYVASSTMFKNMIKSSNHDFYWFDHIE